MILIDNQQYWVTRWLFQRALAVIYLVAFVVAVNQFRPLLGTRGLLPVPFFLQRVNFLQSPSLFFLHYSDRFAMALGWTGVALALFALSGFSESFGTPVSMAVWFVMWLFYLSCSAAIFRSRRDQLWQVTLSPRGVMGGLRVPR